MSEWMNPVTTEHEISTVHTTDLFSQARWSVPLEKILGSEHWPGLHRVAGPIYHLFLPDQSQRRFIIQDHFHWYDAINGKVGDGFDLLCLLRGLTPDNPSLSQEFLALAGVPMPLTEEVGSDCGRPQIALENVGNCSANLWVEMKIDAENIPTTTIGTKRKTPGDLLPLISAGEPILQADLFKAVSARGINERAKRGRFAY
jgi:hypothetical protein